MGKFNFTKIKKSLICLDKRNGYMKINLHESNICNVYKKIAFAMIIKLILNENIEIVLVNKNLVS